MLDAPLSRLFEERTLEAVCDVLSTKCLRLTGAELVWFYRSTGIADVAPGPPKASRMFEALRQHQIKAGSGATIVALIRHAFNPVRLVGSRHQVAQARMVINTILAPAGWEVLSSGQVRYLPVSMRAIGDAAPPRHVRAAAAHLDVPGALLATVGADKRASLVADATRALAEKLSRRDDARAALAAMRPGPLDLRRAPRVALRVLSTCTSRREQARLVRVLRYLFSACAQRPGQLGTPWPMTHPQALDLLTAISVIERRLGGRAS